MINFIIPENTTTAVNLEDSIKQTQVIIQNNKFVNRTTNIIHSRDVLFFHVNRTSNNIHLANIKPFSINLPTALGGFERLNDTSVIVPNQITVGEKEFTLRSVVISVINENDDLIKEKLVIGSATIIVTQPSFAATTPIPEYFLYNPLNMYDPKSHKYYPIKVPHIPQESAFIQSLIETKGVIYMYQLVPE